VIKNIKISNFRSIKDCSVELAPVTVVYGSNAAGKSSLFYALNVMRNVATDPNQSVDSFFNLNFINMGGFHKVVHKNEDSSSIGISASGKLNGFSFTYKILIKQKSGEFSLEIGKPYNLKLNLPVSFPYPLNSSTESSFKINDAEYKVTWNGITGQVSPTSIIASTDEANKHTKLINSIVEHVRAFDIVPMTRGFTKAQYGIVSSKAFPINDDEVVSKLANDDLLDRKVSTYLEQVVDRQSITKTAPGTTLVHLYTTEKESKQTMDIVNDGFGVNQLVYLLAKSLIKNLDVLCIEEPELNLHPQIINKLPGLFIELARDESRQVFISTHSESLMLAILNSVSAGLIRGADVACYLTKKQNGLTTFKRESVTKDGQIEGGLVSFIAANVEDITNFFPAKSTGEPLSIEEKLTTEETPTQQNDESKETAQPQG
jgi:predicted ATPase